MREPNPATTDSELIPRLRQRDAQACELLVRLYGPRLLAVARRLMRRDEDASDALQDAFLSAFNGIDRFEGNSALSTWLHAIVVRSCLMKLRTRRRHPETSIEELLPRFLDDGHRADPGPAWGGTVEDLAERKEVRALVRLSIDQLPEGYRTVLLLRDIEGYDTEQTAAAMGITANTVKVRLHRARQALRTLLDPQFGGGRYDL